MLQDEGSNVVGAEADMEVLQKRARDVPAVAIVVEHLIECYDAIFNDPLPPLAG